MKIWLINQYNMPPEYGHLNRHFNFGKYLKMMGHEPVVLVGSFLHNTNFQMINGNEPVRKYDKADFPFYFIKTCSYSTSSIKRIFAMFEFYRGIFKAAKMFDRPDVILGSSAHPLTALAAIRASRKYGCMSVVEIRDLWPESLAAYGFISPKNPLMHLLYAGEKWLYRKADRVIFTMEGGRDYIIDRGWDKGNGGLVDLDKVYHINNGVDLDVFEKNKREHTLTDEDLNDPAVFKVVYTGSIRLVNNVRSIVDAAYEIKKQGISDVKFLIYGDGNERIPLEKYCADKGIDNVVFKGFMEKKYIPYILSMSDLNLIHFEQNELKKYGASLNKFFEYFASGKPVLSDCEFGYDLVRRYKCGTIADGADPSELARQVIVFRELDKSTYDEFCRNALSAAKDYDFKNLTLRLLDVLQPGVSVKTGKSDGPVSNNKSGKVCHITVMHGRYDVRIFSKECRSLAGNGYDVTLLVNDDLEDEIKDGVKIVSMRLGSRRRSELLTVKKKPVWRKMLETDADIYHFHDPELLPHAARIKRRGKIVVFDFHEDVAKLILFRTWIPKFARKVLSNIYARYEESNARNFDALITVTPAFVDRLKKINENTVMLTNFPVFTDKEVPDHDSRKRAVCFAGGVSAQWNHENIIRAIEKIDDIEYILAGNAQEKYLESLKSLEGWNKVRFLGRVPHEKVREIYDESMIGMTLLSYDTQVSDEGTLGNTKLFEFMEAGLPVICSDNKLWKQIAENDDCGVAIDPNNVGKISEAIEFLLQNHEKASSMGKNGYDAVKHKYNWGTQEAELLKLYRFLTGKTENQ